MAQNPDTPKIRLDHINMPARKPAWLAEWYAEQFGFQAKGGFVIGEGALLVFETGEPLDYRGGTHFGFRCDSFSRCALGRQSSMRTLKKTQTTVALEQRIQKEISSKCIGKRRIE